MGAARLMRVIIDSNILLSALISPRGPPHQIYRAWRQRRFELVTSTIQLDEIRRASRYPKFRGILQPHRVGHMVNNLQSSVVLDHLSGRYETADPHDDWLLALADAAKADFLVTGDKQSGLLERRRIGTARILTASEFCRTVLQAR